MNNYVLEKDMLEVLGPVLEKHGLTFRDLSIEPLRRRVFERGLNRWILLVEVSSSQGV